VQECVPDSPDLRSFLRLRRGDSKQWELAATARLSLSRYKRLESGRALAVRLDVLLRVAAALRLDAGERLELVRLARPDLAFLLSAAGAPPLGYQWRSVHKLARRLGQAKGSRDPACVAVEIVHASLGLDMTVFALELHSDGRREVGFCIGAPDDSIVVPEALVHGGFHVETLGDRRFAYVPMSRDGRVFGALGIAYPRENRLDPKCFAFLGMVAALLEVRLNDRVEQVEH
jgi:hypothetical protein